MKGPAASSITPARAFFNVSSHPSCARRRARPSLPPFVIAALSQMRFNDDLSPTRLVKVSRDAGGGVVRAYPYVTYVGKPLRETYAPRSRPVVNALNE